MNTSKAKKTASHAVIVICDIMAYLSRVSTVVAAAATTAAASCYTNGSRCILYRNVLAIAAAAAAACILFSLRIPLFQLVHLGHLLYCLPFFSPLPPLHDA